MTTSVIFKIDHDIKKKAAERAVSEGMTLSSVLKLATRAYAERRIDVKVASVGEIPNARTAKLLDEIDEDIANGRNLSPRFSDIGSFLSSLKREIRSMRRRS